MPAIDQPIPNANADETASRQAALDAQDKALVADLETEIAKLSERIAHSMRRLRALRPMTYRTDREVNAHLIEQARRRR